MRQKVLVFGSCNLDMVFSVPHIALPGETIGASDVAVHCGGKGLNQAVALARAGIPTAFAGSIGADGASLRNMLNENGVDTKYLRDSDVPTGRAIIQVADNGENAIVLYHGANYDVTRQQIDDTLAEFQAGDVIVLQNEISEIIYLIERASSLGMRIVLNPSPFHSVFRTVELSRLALLIVNETEAAGFTGSSDTDAFLQWTEQNCPSLPCVLTLGETGSVYTCGGVTIRQPAIAADVVDTTCAGDTFTGYFLAARLRGKDVPAALEIAARAASLTISQPGAAQSIPLAAQLTL